MKPHRPLVYCASSTRRAAMWPKLIASVEYFQDINVTSTWFNTPNLEIAEADPNSCRIGWRKNHDELIDSQFLMVYAEPTDRPEGTFVEIGLALANAIPVVLVGQYHWGSWRFLRNIHVEPTFREAIEFMVAANSEGGFRDENSEGDFRDE